MFRYIFSFLALTAFTFAAPMAFQDSGSIAVAKSYKHNGGHAYHGGGYKKHGYKKGYNKGYKKGYKHGHNKYYGAKPYKGKKYGYHKPYKGYKYGYNKPYKKYYGYSGHYNKHYYGPKKHYKNHYYKPKKHYHGHNYYKPKPYVVNNYYYKPYPKRHYKPYGYGYGYGGYYNSPLFPLANLAGYLIYNSNYKHH